MALVDVEGSVGPDGLGSQLLGDYILDQPAFFDAVARNAGTGLSAIAVDFMGLVTAMALALALPVYVQGGTGFSRSGWLVACLPIFLAFLADSRHRLARRLSTSIGRQLREVALPMAGAAFTGITGWRVLGALAGWRVPTQDGIVLTCLLGVVTVSLVRCAFHRRGSPARVRRVLLVGSGAVADRISARLEADGSASVIGFVDDDPKDPTGCLGPLRSLGAVCETQQVDHVVVAFSRASSEDLVDALREVQGRLPISVVPRLFDVLPATAEAHDLASGYPAMSVGSAAFGTWPRMIKRSVDIAGAVVGLLLCSPVLLVGAVGVRLSSPGPILLRHRRVGRNGKEFSCFKFRTFTVTESATPADILALGEQVTGPFPKLKNDPRATRFGRMLRRTSVDELPQLLNVLTGSMSLVGPRPVAPEHAWSFGTWALRRYAVKPGLTGLWQVSGRNDLTHEEMCRLDHLYVTSWSVGLDFHVLARTARAVVGGQGCY